MKKLINLTLPIGIVLLIFILFHGSEQANGATKGTIIGVDEQNGTEQVGPPWFDEAWLYRRPIIINSSTALPWYQVLITLDSGNFPSFNLARSDGRDVRFTHSDGTTELKYWIESWDKANQKAYIWVRVPSLASGNTTIYLYYDNPAATSHNDGIATFDSFDENWSQYTSAEYTLVEDSQSSDSDNNIEGLFTWSIINGTPEVLPPGELILVDGTGIKSTTTYQYQAVGFKANFGLGSGKEWGGFINGASGQYTRIGDLTTDVDDLYLINYVNSSDNTILEGVNDWHNEYHVYEVRWSAGQSIGEIDHGASNATSAAQVPTGFLPVTLYSYPGSNATLKVDWVYVRQYRNPEPTSTLGSEQGLVDLGISVIDSPDPLHIGAELTYLLTISNTSSIEARGVVVTDTLPGSVLFVSGKTSPECGQDGSEILCSLSPIAANSTTSVTIVVNPTIDGIITNTVAVASSGFDLDMSNNWGDGATLVDSIPPNVNWENPVRNGQSFTSYGGLVSLVASATDNDQVAWVEFWLWDHLPIANPKGKISIGIDDIYPYQVQFNSEILVPNQTYQMFVQAADRADNISSIYTAPHPVIYIERFLLYFINIPIAVK